MSEPSRVQQQQQARATRKRKAESEIDFSLCSAKSQIGKQPKRTRVKKPDENNRPESENGSCDKSEIKANAQNSSEGNKSVQDVVHAQVSEEEHLVADQQAAKSDTSPKNCGPSTSMEKRGSNTEPVEKSRLKNTKKKMEGKTLEKEVYDGALSQEQATRMVENYLQSQNRPYSLQNIYDNLHGKIPKGLLTKILDSHSQPSCSEPNTVASKEGSKIIFKEYGKFKVYLINQAVFEEKPGSGDESVVTFDFKSLDEEIKKLGAETVELTRRVSYYQDKRLGLSLAELEKLSKESFQKLEYIKEQTSHLELDPDQYKAAGILIREKKESLRDILTKRRKIKTLCDDMMYHIASVCETSVKDVAIQVGIDEEEEEEEEEEGMQKYGINL